jgi:hypothetical protein
MSEDSDDFQAATQLIERHGEGAALVASDRVRTMRERGDTAGLRRWSRILAMIEKLQRAPSKNADDENDLSRSL